MYRLTFDFSQPRASNIQVINKELGKPSMNQVSILKYEGYLNLMDFYDTRKPEKDFMGTLYTFNFTHLEIRCTSKRKSPPDKQFRIDTLAIPWDAFPDWDEYLRVWSGIHGDRHVVAQRRLDLENEISVHIMLSEKKPE